MKERIHEFLQNQDGRATSEMIASEALGLKGAKGGVADRVVEAAIEGDLRFSQRTNGVWILAPPKKETPIRDAQALIVGAIESNLDSSIKLAACRVHSQGPGIEFPEFEIDPQKVDSVEGLESFASFALDLVPVSFRFPRISRQVNHVARQILGKPIFSEGICLFRLARRLFPNQSFPDLESLAGVLGLTYYSNKGLDAAVQLQGEIFLRFLERCEAQGMSTLSEVMADLYPSPTPVRFEAFAFDEMFLDDLPGEPGVYIMRDDSGCVIYVGKAVDLRQRVGHYFSRRSERTEKTQGILARIWSVEVESVGSELEALILESHLIRICQPEFNTQVKIHEQGEDFGLERNFVLFLPSSESDCLELFCVRDNIPLEQIRVRRDLRDWQAVSERLVRIYFEQGPSELERTEEDAADLEILRRWLSIHRESVNTVDMESVGRKEEAIRVLSSHIQNFNLDAGERVWQR